jgi:hypothetical protein
LTESPNDFRTDPEGVAHPPAEQGVGTPFGWVRFLILLVLIATPLVFLFRAGARRVGGTVTVPGHLTWGHEVRAFEPCAGGPELWLVGTPEVLGILVQEHERLRESTGTGPYQPVFAVLMGEELPPSTEGFATGYEGRFRVVGVDRLAPLSAEDCPPF